MPARLLVSGYFASLHSLLILPGSMVSVIDFTGKELVSQQAAGNDVVVNLNSLPGGMYILQYADENHREQQMFTKQ